MILYKRKTNYIQSTKTFISYVLYNEDLDESFFYEDFGSGLTFQFSMIGNIGILNNEKNRFQKCNKIELAKFLLLHYI